jgi:hypothetical protein
MSSLKKSSSVNKSSRIMKKAMKLAEQRENSSKQSFNEGSVSGRT